MDDPWGGKLSLLILLVGPTDHYLNTIVNN